MADLTITPASGPLRGIVPGPPDRATAELGLLLAALAAPGATSRLWGKGLAALEAPRLLAQLGVAVAPIEDGYEVSGVGPSGLVVTDTLALPRSPWLAAATLGVLAGAGIACRLEGLSGSPQVLALVAQTLRQRGAQIEGRFDPRDPSALHPPLVLEAASAPLAEQLVAPSPFPAKVAALASGLFAAGPTYVDEPVLASDRFERLLGAMGLAVDGVGAVRRLSRPASEPLALSSPVPASPDASLALLAAGLGVAQSQVGVRGIALGPAHLGALKALERSGASLRIEARETRCGLPTADVTILAGPRRGLDLEGELASASGASLPTLLALAATASTDPGGRVGNAPPSVLSDPVAEIERPGRTRGTLALARAFGLAAEAEPGRLVLLGGPLVGATFDPEGDPAVAMAACALALAAKGPTTLRHADCIVESAPRFVGSLRALGAQLEVRP
ncbi:MAG: hypothetical protein R3B72_16795 [Polyangiaceae bacterium]